MGGILGGGHHAFEVGALHVPYLVVLSFYAGGGGGEGVLGCSLGWLVAGR